MHPFRPPNPSDRGRFVFLERHLAPTSLAPGDTLDGSDAPSFQGHDRAHLERPRLELLAALAAKMRDLELGRFRYKHHLLERGPRRFVALDLIAQHLLYIDHSPSRFLKSFLKSSMIPASVSTVAILPSSRS